MTDGNLGKLLSFYFCFMACACQPKQHNLAKSIVIFQNLHYISSTVMLIFMWFFSFFFLSSMHRKILQEGTLFCS